jgi:hypothetical protein
MLINTIPEASRTTSHFRASNCGVPPARASASSTCSCEELKARAPAGVKYRRPDLRHVDRLLEKMLTFQTGVNKPGEAQQTLSVELPGSGRMSIPFPGDG